MRFEAVGVRSSGFVPTSRAEHLIAAGRAILAAVALLAIWIDPTEPSYRENVAYGLLGGYLGCALLMWFWVSRVTVVPASLGLLTHAADLIVFVSLQSFTSAVSSPFFLYFLFALVAATIRWRLRGVLWTGAVALAAFLALAFGALLFGKEEFDVTRVLVRGGYLVVMTGLLAYLGTYEQGLLTERARLAGWPQPGSPADARACGARAQGAPRRGAVGALRGAVALREDLDDGSLRVDPASSRHSSGSRPGSSAGASLPLCGYRGEAPEGAMPARRTVRPPRRRSPRSRRASAVAHPTGARSASCGPDRHGLAVGPGQAADDLGRPPARRTGGPRGIGVPRPRLAATLAGGSGGHARARTPRRRPPRWTPAVAHRYRPETATAAGAASRAGPRDRRHPGHDLGRAQGSASLREDGAGRAGHRRAVRPARESSRASRACRAPWRGDDRGANGRGTPRPSRPPSPVRAT